MKRAASPGLKWESKVVYRYSHREHQARREESGKTTKAQRHKGRTRRSERMRAEAALLGIYMGSRQFARITEFVPRESGQGRCGPHLPVCSELCVSVPLWFLRFLPLPT